MVNELAVAAGGVIFLFALYNFWQVYRMSWAKSFYIWWLILVSLILFFVAGYLMFEVSLLFNIGLFDNKAIVSQIFLWGAVFVLITSILFSSISKEQDRFLAESRAAKDMAENSNKELVRTNKFMVGRELDMIKLKEEVDNLLIELGRGPKYSQTKGEK